MEEARQKLKEMEEGLRVALDIHKQCTADGIRYKVRYYLTYYIGFTDSFTVLQLYSTIS